MQDSLKIVFAGTPQFSAEILNDLISQNHEIVAVYTQPDRRSGRGKKITPSAVKQVATENSIPVIQPANFREESDLNALRDLNADLMIVVAYGIILPQNVLDLPTRGCINVHASLLPRWRGAAPIERALLAGDKTTGITIMQMDKGLDTGDMLNHTSINIDDEMTSSDLHDKLIPLACTALSTTLKNILNDTVVNTKQNDGDANYAEKLTKAEGLIDWRQSATLIHRKIRGLIPRPVAFSHLDDQVVRIWKAHIELFDNNSTTAPDIMPGTIIRTSKDGICVSCGEGSVLSLEFIQLPGGKQLSAQQVIASKKELFCVGKQFTYITDTH
jgi:methionyl-tRNA formyltransferase